MMVTANQTPLPYPYVNSYGLVDPHYLGVTFTSNTMAVYHEDGATMPSNSALNVWLPYQSQCPPNVLWP